MIHIEKDVAEFNGTAKELTYEFTHLILSYKYNIMKEFGVSDIESNEIIARCCEIAVMTNEDRQEFLDTMKG